MTGQNEERAVLIGSSFMLGMFAGFLLKDAAMRAFKRARTAQWHRGYEETLTYDQNLPDQLERREPEPREGQPRFGGTGALGVPPERAL